MCLHYIFGPMQRYHFLPRLPSCCHHRFGSHLSEDSLGMGQPASFSVTNVPLPILYLIFLLGRNQQNLLWCQHFSMASTLFWATVDNQNGKEVGRSDTARHPSSVSWFLPKSTGSSSLLPHDIIHIKCQKTLDWLHCRSSALDHKAEHGSWYLMH